MDNFLYLPKILALYRNPLLFIFDKLRWIGSGKIFTVALRNGLRFKIHSGNSDINSVTEIFISEMYRPFFDWIPQALSPVIVDVGANVGLVSIAAAKRFPKARVFAFEPNPHILPLLEENVRLNAAQSNIFLRPFCVAGEGGIRPVFYRPGERGGATLFRKDAPGTETFEATCVPLSEIFNIIQSDVIDFLKVDCEGAEYEIFKHSSPEDFRKIKFILAECHEPFVSAEQLGELLGQQGFSVEYAPAFSTLYAYNKNSRLRKT